VELFGNASRWVSKKGASTCAEVEKEVKAWWKTVDESLLKAVDDWVLCNHKKILELHRGNFNGESTK